LLFTVLFFLRVPVASHAVLLYKVLPSLAAAIAGFIWGGAILDSSRVKTYGQSVLRGLGVSAGAYFIFSIFYACELPLLEGQWSLERVGSLVLFVLMLGPLMVAPLVAIGGVTSGITLYGLGRLIGANSDAGSSDVGSA